MATEPAQHDDAPLPPRVDDQVFVRRCRLVVVGILRLAAIVMAWRAVELMLMELVQTTRFVVAGQVVRSWVSYAPVALAFASAAAAWFTAPWLARLMFRMPPDRHQCPKCRYPVQGLDRCPECGTRIR